MLYFDQVVPAKGSGRQVFASKMFFEVQHGRCTQAPKGDRRQAPRFFDNSNNGLATRAHTPQE